MIQFYIRYSNSNSRVSSVSHLLEDVGNGTWDNTPVLVVFSCSCHGERFSCSCLPITQKGAIVSTVYQVYSLDLL